MNVRKLSISLPPDMLAQVALRERDERERSGAIDRSLKRYFAALGYHRRRLAGMFSEPELSLILDALNGVWFLDDLSPNFVFAEISDAIRLNRSDEKWGVDGAILVERMRALTYADNLALIDAAERWWHRVGAGENPEVKEALR